MIKSYWFYIDKPINFHNIYLQNHFLPQGLKIFFIRSFKFFFLIFKFLIHQELVFMLLYFFHTDGFSCLYL